MKKWFIIMVLLLTFASISSTEQPVIAESPPAKISTQTSATATDDTIKIVFNKNTFIKKFPKTMSEAVETIKGLQHLFNMVSESYRTLDSSFNIVKCESATLSKKADNYKLQIDSLVNVSDSLSGVIVSKSTEINTIVSTYIDSIAILAKSINSTYNKDLRIGLGVGYARGDLEVSKINEFTISPMLVYKRLYVTTDLGVYAFNDDYKSKVGASVGFLIR